MTDKILEAVKALGGNIENINSSDGDKSNYVALCVKDSSDGFVNAFRGEYWGVMGNFNSESFKKICTAEEFNTYAAEWLKEAYMHNAAIDLGWDIGKIMQPSCVIDELRHSEGKYARTGCREWDLVCTYQEFIDYCETNKPQSQIETPEEKEAFDMIDAKRKVPSEKMKAAIAEAKEIEAKLSSDSAQCNSEVLLTVGDYVRIDGKSIGGVLRAIFLDGQGRKNAAVELEDGACVSLGLWRVEPIKSPRDKAVEALSKTIGGHEYPFGLIYDWLKSLTPEQKKEFGL